MDDLSIRIRAILDSTSSQNTKKQIKDIQTQLEKTPIQLRIETNVGIASQEMTKAAKNYEKVWEKAFYNQKQTALKTAQDIKNAYNKQLFDNFNKSLGIGAVNTNKITAANSALVQLFENSKKSTLGLNDLEKQVLKLNPNMIELHEVTKRSAQSLSGMAIKFTSWYLLGGIISGLIGSIKTAIQSIIDLESQMTSIARVMDDVNFKMDQYRNNLIDIAKETGSTFKDSSDVALRFAQAGYNVVDSLNLTKTAMAAVQTAELDAKNATESMIGIMSQWSMKASDMPLLLDKINKISDEYTVTSQDLVDGLLRSSSAAKNLGLSVDETISLLTVLRESSGRTGKKYLPIYIAIYILYRGKSVKTKRLIPRGVEITIPCNA